MADFELAPQEIQDMAKRLIDRHHSHLVEAKICVMFRSGSWRSKGKDVLGRAIKVSDRDKLLHGYDFLIILNEKKWYELNHKQQEALLDHELCHCQRGVDSLDGSPTWCIGSHDVEEFAAIIRRHGLWRENVAHFVNQHWQLSMFDDKEDQGEINQANLKLVKNN